MSGNVWEWTWNGYNEEETNYHWIYGGSWDSESDECNRHSGTEKASNSVSEETGFRIVRTIK